jgi:hypothetical protein
MTAQINLNTQISAEDKASAALNSAAESALDLAQAELEAAEAAEKASDQTTDAKKATVSASKKVALAMKQEAAGADPLKQKMVALQGAHETLKVKMAAMVKAGEEIPPGMAKAANAASKAAEAIRRQGNQVQKAAPKQKRLSELLKEGADAFAKYAIAAGAGVVLGAIKNLVTEHIKLGNEIAKTSQRLGVSVEGLQEYQFAAQSSGVETDQLADAFKDLNLRTADAMAGNQDAANAFKTLGVELTDAEGRIKTVEELLPELADGFAAQADQSQRAALATKTMGEAGLRLLPMLQNGSAELAKMRNRARELGGVMSGEAARAAEDTSQAIFELQTVSGGFATDIAVALTPAIKGVTDALLAVRAEIERDKEAFETLVSIGLSVLTMGASDTVQSLQRLTGATKAQREEEQQAAEDRREHEAERQAQARLQAARERKREEWHRRRLEQQDEIQAKVLETYNYFEQLETDAQANEEARRAREDEIWLANLNKRAEIEKQEQARQSEALEAQKKEQQAMAEAAKKNSEAAAEATAKSWIATGTQIGATMGEAFAAVAKGEMSAGQAIMRITNQVVQAGISAAQELIAAKAAEAAAGSLAAYSSIPFVGLALGLAAAGAVVSAIMGMASFAEGGMVTGGTPGQDSVPAMLMPGEFVVPAAATEQLKDGATLTMAPRGGSPAGGNNYQITIQMLEIPDQAKLDRFVRDELVPAIERVQQI